MRSIVKDQSGTVIALFALSLPVVLTAIGLAVDYSDLVRKRTSLQSAADDAALASTKVLALSGAATPPQKETGARIAAEKIRSTGPTSSSPRASTRSRTGLSICRRMRRSRGRESRSYCPAPTPCSTFKAALRSRSAQ
jgi:Flp pilus assembly protein TadG